MSKIPSVGDEDIKAQLSEYHLIVAEVIGGISFDLIETKKRVDELETQLEHAIHEIQELKTATRLLVQASLKEKGNDL